jgi:hypothetical protein
MDPEQTRVFLVAWPRELNDSVEFHVELETLLAEFSMRLGTLAEPMPPGTRGPLKEKILPHPKPLK